MISSNFPPNRNLKPYGSTPDPRNTKTDLSREKGFANEAAAAEQMRMQHLKDEQVRSIKQRAKYDYDSKKRQYDRNKAEITQFQFEIKRLGAEIVRIKSEVDAGNRAKLIDKTKTESMKKDSAILYEKIKDLELQLIQMKKDYDKRVSDMKQHDVATGIRDKADSAKTGSLTQMETKKKNDEIALEHLEKQNETLEREMKELETKMK